MNNKVHQLEARIVIFDFYHSGFFSIETAFLNVEHYILSFLSHLYLPAFHVMYNIYIL